MIVKWKCLICYHTFNKDITYKGKCIKCDRNALVYKEINKGKNGYKQHNI